jgi:hypothetical protein
MGNETCTITTCCPTKEQDMKVNIYISDSGWLVPRYGFLPPHRPITILPHSEKWKYVRSGDTAEFNLPEAVVEEIERHGFWAHTFGSGLHLA